jgi:hypothetical protein
MSDHEISGLMPSARTALDRVGKLDCWSLSIEVVNALVGALPRERAVECLNFWATHGVFANALLGRRILRNDLT